MAIEGDDKGQGSGVNISGGMVNVGRDLRGNDLRTQNVFAHKELPSPIIEPSISHDSKSSIGKWTEEDEQQLENNTKITQAVGKKVLKEWVDEKGIHKIIANDEITERTGHQCPFCGHGLTSNPYTKLCGSCGQSHGLHINRKQKEEFIPITPATEADVRKLAKGPKTIQGSDSTETGAFISVSVKFSSNIHFNNVVVLDSVSIKNSSFCDGTIFVPEGFESIKEIHSSNISIKIITKTWTELAALIKQQEQNA